MNALDFQYDGLRLSDFGCIICTFENNGLETFSVGSQITFNTTPIASGRKHLLAGIKYEEYIELEFQICKNPDEIYDEEEKYFTVDEVRNITRWLNRGQFKKFKLIDDECNDYYFEASFNISRLEIAGRIVGMHLTVITNRPFALHEPVIHRFNPSAGHLTYTVLDISDEIGYSYIELEITCKQNGDLKITNAMDGRTTEILNCKNNEKITISNMIIETSLPEHKATLQNDFNFVFPRVMNTYKKRDNKLTFSIPCSVVLKYNPIRKVGI